MSPESQVKGLFTAVGANRIDIDAAPALVACVYRQVLTAAALHQIGKHPFDTRFVEVIVLTERDDILKQCRVVDLWPAVADLQAADIRL